ncbi:MAG: glycine--tRNA ligase subunit beta [Alphaproteobacteria bacterium]|nr:glycine--tRNA ligase subunit beta [Alphaproteobacteria bacterium]
MPELLLELLSEEMPASLQARVADELKGRITEALGNAKLSFSAARAYSTPRRLTLVVEGLPATQPDVREERKGPRVGGPESAVLGFCRASGIARDALEQRDTDRGCFYFAVKMRAGRPTAEVLGEIVPQSVAALSWPKSMRWGQGTLRWVRPLRRIVCLFAADMVPLSLDGLGGANATVGHRSAGATLLVVRDFADYEAKLRSAKVMLDPAERRAHIVAETERHAGAAGLRLRSDPALIDELVGLVEWPVVLMGRIEDHFLALPEEVLVAAMRSHQRYLALEHHDGRLAPRFLVAANLAAPDGGAAIIAGNERVLRARLADAAFFWEQDRKQPLADRVPRLAEIVFHAKLGTVAAKVDRIEALAGGIAAHVPGASRDRVRSAARLCKADLVTGMVGEFPELQGIMGRYYARHDGEHDEVATAIAEHYAPQGPNDRCPSAPVSVALALADKLDTLVGFFAIGEPPTGSRDPFALRRAALGLIRLVLENGIRLPLRERIREAWHLLAEHLHHGIQGDAPDPEQLAAQLLEFFADRLKVHLREKGLRHDLIGAVFALHDEDDIVRLMARVEALSDFLASEDGANLLTAFRRANNIVAIEERRDRVSYRGDALATGLFREPDEARLHAALATVGAAVTTALAAEDFAGAGRAFARLRPAVDAFFDHVTVNSEDAALRANRLRLLDLVRRQFALLGDFALIKG